MERYVYIVLSRTPSFVGKMIRLISRYDYNHVSISLDKNLNQMYSFGRLSVNNPIIGGIIRENPYTFSLGYEREIKVKIYRIPVSRSQYHKIKNFVDDIYNDYEGYYYNLLGVFGAPLRRNWRLYKTFICSEFVAECIQHAGLELIHEDSYMIKPKDIDIVMKPFLFEEGNLFSYPFLTEASLSKVFLQKDEFFIRRSILQEIACSISHLKMLLMRNYKNRSFLTKT